MKEIKTFPRFRCDFCKKTGIKRIINYHEITCYRNPNRICRVCNNTKMTDTYCPLNGYVTGQEPCVACEKFDPEQLRGILAHEEELRLKKLNPYVSDADIALPF